MHKQRHLALEELAFQERIKQRSDNAETLAMQIKSQVDANLITQEQGNAELLDLQSVTDRISEEQLTQHEENKLAIRAKFAIKTKDIQSIDLLKEQQDFFDAETKAISKQAIRNSEIEIAAQEKATKTTEERTKTLLKNIGAAAKTISEQITKLFEKQADLSKERVDQQSDNLSNARDRAAKGLSANIAFEEKELAARQAEQQRRQKEAEQAAKLLTLFNLVSAYAQNGDQNALFRGLADFSILTAFEAGIDGFYDGTEDTGTAGQGMDSNGGRLAILHNNERVVTKAQNMRLNGMSNDDLVHNALIGEQMGDYLNPQSIAAQNLFKQQKSDFVSSMTSSSTAPNPMANVENTLVSIQRQLAAQPNIGIEIQKVYENVYDMIRTEVKANLKKRGRKRL